MKELIKHINYEAIDRRRLDAESWRGRPSGWPPEEAGGWPACGNPICRRGGRIEDVVKAVAW